MAEHKQSITVTLEVKEILYDIENKTHLTGLAREAEGKKNYETAAHMQASDDNEISYQIHRKISDYFAKIKVLLGEYLDENATTTNNRIKDEVDSDGTLLLAFKLPSNFNNSSVDSLGSGCHNYIVNNTISEWFVITNPEEAQNYSTLAEEALETAKRALYKRARPTRPIYPEPEPEPAPEEESEPNSGT